MQDRVILYPYKYLVNKKIKLNFLKKYTRKVVFLQTKVKNVFK